MEIKPQQELEIVSGVNININVADGLSSYILKANNISLSSNWELVAIGTPIKGMTCEFYMIGGIVLTNGNTFKILGVTIPDLVIATNKSLIKAYYNGSAWVVQTYANANSYKYIKSTNIADKAVTEVKIASGGTTGQILIDDGTDVAYKTLSGDITLNSDGVAAIADNAITTAKLSTEVRRELITAVISFASKTTFPVRVAYDCDVKAVTYTCLENLTAAGAEKISLLNNTGSTIGGLDYNITGDVPAGTQTARKGAVSNNDIDYTDNFQIKVEGSTSSGQFLVQIEVERR